MIQKDGNEQLIFTGSIRDLAKITLLLAGDVEISDLKNIHEYKRLQQTRFLMALFGSRGQIRTTVELCYRSIIIEEVKSLLRDDIENGNPGERSEEEIKKGVLTKIFLRRVEKQEAKKQEACTKESKAISHLTPRQIQIAKLLLEGYNYAEIAAKLFIEANTVRGHAKRVYEILGVKGRQELITLLGSDGFDLICKRFDVVL